MKNKTMAGVISILALALVINACLVQAETEIAGVKVGNWVKYGISKTNNPRTWYPGMEEARWVLVNVTQVDEQYISINETIDGKNSTSTSFDIVNYEETSFRYIILPNLNVGDKVIRIPVEFNDDKWRVADLNITNAFTKTYRDVSREVVSIVYNWTVEEPGLGTINNTLEMTWDRETGFMLERIATAKYPDSQFESSMFVLTVVGTNMWSMPPIGPIVLVTSFICMLFVAVAVVKKRKGRSDKQ